MTNLCTYRAITPSLMFKADDPIDGENDVWIARLGKQSGIIVAVVETEDAF